MRTIFCGTTAIEYTHISDVTERNWLKTAFERGQISGLPTTGLDNKGGSLARLTRKQQCQVAASPSALGHDCLCRLPRLRQPRAARGHPSSQCWDCPRLARLVVCGVLLLRVGVLVVGRVLVQACPAEPLAYSPGPGHPGARRPPRALPGI